MYIRVSAIALTAFTVLGMAQSRDMEHSKASMNGGAHIVFRGLTMEHPSSILDLIRGSTLIVDGSVTTVLPSTMASSEQATVPIIQTDSVVAINSILRGKVQNDAINILLAQVGGKVGQWETEADGDPLVSAGERYILFLTPDTRKVPASMSGMPRYDVTGIWAGKIRVTNGTVRFAAASGPALHSFDGSDVDHFLSVVRETINHPLQQSIAN